MILGLTDARTTTHGEFRPTYVGFAVLFVPLLNMSLINAFIFSFLSLPQFLILQIRDGLKWNIVNITT